MPECPLQTSDTSLKAHTSTSNTGRPTIDFEHLNDMLKRRKTQILRDNHTTDELVYATKMKLRKQSRLEEAKFCSDTHGKNSQKQRHGSFNKAETPLTPTEALAMLINTNMSKASYIYLRKLHK